MTQLLRRPTRPIALSAFVLTALMTACNPQGGTSTVTGVTVSPATVTLPPSSTASLTATVSGTGSFTQTVTWTSSDSSVAKVDANGVVTAIKTGSATVTATSTSDTTKSGTSKVTVDASAFPPDGVKVNFQPTTTAAISGYAVDSGAPYNDTRGYGWITQATATAATASHVPLDLSKNTRDRKIAGVEPRLNTFIHMQYTSGSADGTATPGAWEYKVPNGTYTVTVAVGDATSIDSTNVINVENQPAITAFTPVNERHFRASTLRVNVTDGRITVDARTGTNTKLAYAIIAPGTRPSVATTSPDEGQTLVFLDDSFTADLNTVKTSNATGVGIDAKTLTASSVKLTNLATGAAVAATLNTSGGGDAIVLKPNADLAANTRYRVDVTSGLKDNAGNAFLPYSTTFTTGTSRRGNSALAFTQVKLPNVPTDKAYTSVEMGPDGKLYAATLGGEILRFAINADGTLAAPQIITSLIAQQGPRTIIGLKFDPTSTADNLILWISNNNTYDFTKDVPDWTGKITRLSGPNLATVQDVVTGLPRSVKDHLTNSVAFNPKESNVLYVLQGSNSAMGAADPTWGNRPERLLSGAMLRLDLNRLPQSAWPLNAKTSDGGSYNPYAAGAPLTLYATGIRNAYDMVWHTNGQVYVPTNGSAAGGNTPAGTPGAPCADGTTYSGPSVPPLTNASLQNDYLFRIQQGGYYGHPNTLRCQFVMNGGNPTNVADPAEVVAFGSNSGYPVGTMPDKNYKGFAFNFGEHASANGAIEEYSTVSTSATKNKLLVVRYSKQKDIIVLTPGGTSLDIVSSQEGVAGLTFSPSPLDLTENRTNGYLYVAQLDETTGSGTITLAKPKPQ
ncbi:Ig-like domain-containing protein [Deinococcus yunweiensis]|uniref:Ig-like domain-containing protein n=1 Tax=Deinococcus yunweiensis TaxID=367282 RepID=UPI00398E3D26